jgi:alpha-ketoglutaric semialdehyde dehydrogenase
MSITGKHLIAGEWVQAKSPSFSSVNPRSKSNGAMIFADASEAEINRAVEEAQKAYAETRLYSAEKLAGFLVKVAEEIEALGDELLSICDGETGLGLPRLTGERGRTCNQLRAFAAHIREGSYVEAIIDKALPNRQPAPRPDIRRMLIPVGVVAVFPPNNFPLAFGVAGGDTSSAFAAGCPVIAKCHPSHPATSELVAQAIHKAIEACGFPKGFFALLHGTSIDVGQTLVKHPKLAAVGFTGSLRGGRAIYNTAAARPKPIPVYAEMGSVNPVIILPDALKTRKNELVQGLAASVTLGSGQFCTNPGLVLMLESPETQQFIQELGSAMAALVPGVLLNAAVEQGLTKGVSAMLHQEAVGLVTGGHKLEADGFSFENTVLKVDAKAFMAEAELREELFGPVTVVVSCASMEEIEAVLGVLEGNLTATIHATDAEEAGVGRLFSLLRETTGRLILNGYPTGVEVVHAMVHGGPYPATTVPNSTSVGMTAIQRFLRPVAYQNTPDNVLPDALKNANPLGIWRIVDNELTKARIE